MAVDLSQVIVVLDGHHATRLGRLHSLTITDELNDAPNTARLTTIPDEDVHALDTAPFYPGAFAAGAFWTVAVPVTVPGAHAGQTIQIYLGVMDATHLIFGGEVIVLEQIYELVPQHVAFHLSCLDFSRRGNRKQVLRTYGQQSATAIVTDLVTRYTDLTPYHVVANLPTVTGGITFTWEDVSRALSRVAEQIGASWYWDYTGDLHFFVGAEADGVPADLVPAGRFADLKVTTDLTQVRTRVLVEGNGSTCAKDVGPGESIIPLRDTLHFTPAGGQAIAGTQRFTYTGVLTGEMKLNTAGDPTTTTIPPTPVPPAAPAAALAAGAGGLTGGPYQYGVTFELADGSRSAVSAVSNAVTIPAAAAPQSTNAAFTNPKAPGPIPVGQSVRYGTTFVDAAGHETHLDPVWASTEIVGSIVTPPPSGLGIVTGSVGGSIAPGWYYYRTSFLTPNGETTTGDAPAHQVGTTTGLQLNAVVSSDTRVVGRRIYRSSVSPTQTIALPWRLVVEIPNNTTTVVTDTLADANLSTATPPAFNSASDVGEAVQISTLPTSSDVRVTKRRIYRRDGSSASAYRFLEEIPNNTTTTYLDNRIGTGTGAMAPTINTINTGAITVTAIALGPAGTVRRRLFRTTAGGTALREVVTIENNTTTSYTDVEADSNLGGAPQPAVAPPGTLTVPAPTPIGATSLRVADYAAFPVSGWMLVGDQVIRYTGKSSAAGAFYLTGIPAAGVGAITATIPVGEIITAAPALTGVTLSAPIAAGDTVQLLVVVDDTAAQATLAALEGGDGIIEQYIQDRRLSEAGARARALASLDLFKAVEVRIAYLTYDPETRSGRTVHVDLPAPTTLTGDFLIQSVDIDQVNFSPNFFPRRRVTASSTRFTFENVLQRLLMEEH